MITRDRVFANAAALIFTICPQITYAQTFTSSEVLTWREAQQASLFQTSITMTGIVATPVKPEAAQCMDAWYGGGNAATRHAEILQAMEEFPDYHPQAIILAVIEKACGAF